MDDDEDEINVVSVVGVVVDGDEQSGLFVHEYDEKSHVAVDVDGVDDDVKDDDDH